MWINEGNLWGIQFRLKFTEKFKWWLKKGLANEKHCIINIVYNFYIYIVVIDQWATSCGNLEN